MPLERGGRNSSQRRANLRPTGMLCFASEGGFSLSGSAAIPMKAFSVVYFANRDQK
jgi:hypothetical protein